MLVHGQKAGGHGRIRTVANRCARIRTIEPALRHHRNAVGFRPRRLHLLVLQRRSHVNTEGCTTHAVRYQQQHVGCCSEQATRRRVQVCRSVITLPSHFQCILELVRARVSRALAKRRAQELGAMGFVAMRAPRSRNKTSRKFKFSNMLDFAVCTRCMPSRRLRRLDKPLVLPYRNSRCACAPRVNNNFMRG